MLTEIFLYSVVGLFFIFGVSLVYIGVAEGFIVILMSLPMCFLVYKGFTKIRLSGVDKIKK